MIGLQGPSGPSGAPGGRSSIGAPSGAPGGTSSRGLGATPSDALQDVDQIRQDFPESWLWVDDNTRYTLAEDSAGG